MCLAAVSVSVTVTLELELLSEEEDSGVAAGGGSWLTGGRGGGEVLGLEGRGEDGWMTDSSSLSSWATDITLCVREMQGVSEWYAENIFLCVYTDTEAKNDYPYNHTNRKHSFTYKSPKGPKGQRKDIKIKH